MSCNARCGFTSGVLLQLDWPGFILSASALIAMLYGLELLSHAQHNWVQHDWILPGILTLLGVALSTLVLNFALLNQPETQAGLNEIRLGCVVMGMVAILSALAYLKLPADAGAEVSGHRG